MTMFWLVAGALATVIWTIIAYSLLRVGGRPTPTPLKAGILPDSTATGLEEEPVPAVYLSSIAWRDRQHVA
ncbi:MAG: hypothetical protein NVS1B11_34410 [Terriglobales bacterium]